MIGIIGAMDVEVKDLLARMKGAETETVSGIVYHLGEIAGEKCVVAQCGIGKVAAAVCAQTMILKYAPEAVVNVGVAGGIGPDVHIGDVVVSSGLVQHDMDTTAIGDEKGWISGLKRVVIPASESLTALAAETAGRIYGERKVHVGIIASGDQFISDAERMNRIRDEFGACACEMEGCSVAQVCYMNGTPYTVIRAISDNANEKAAVDYTAFFAESARKTAKLIVGILPAVGRKKDGPA
jgi:adenosylhomocysteine nucleosidase